jgi:hypothetical protein
MMIKSTLSAFLLCVCITANAANDIQASIIEYGIYAHTSDGGQTWINPVSDKMITSNTTAPVHVLTTQEVPAQHPLFFGFEYQLNNLQDGIVKISVDVTHPPIQQADGTYSTTYNEDYDYLAVDGKLSAVSGYLLENKKETQPGKWIFRVRHHDNEILTQEFMVTK